MGRFKRDVGKVPGVPHAVKLIQVFECSYLRQRVQQWSTVHLLLEASKHHAFVRSRGSPESRKLRQYVFREFGVQALSEAEKADEILMQGFASRIQPDTLLGVLASTRVGRAHVQVVSGSFDYSQARATKCFVDFANCRLGGAFLSYGMAQEEVMCHEITELAVILSKSYCEYGKDETPYYVNEEEAFLFRNVMQQKRVCMRIVLVEYGLDYNARLCFSVAELLWERAA